MRMRRTAYLLCGWLLVCAAQGYAAPKNTSRTACKRDCQQQYKALVKACIEFHDPRDVTPSARGQCVERFAKSLQECKEACSDPR